MTKKLTESSAWLIDEEDLTLDHVGEINALLFQLSPSKGENQTNSTKLSRSLTSGSIACVLESGRIVGIAQLIVFEHAADGKVGMLHCVVVREDRRGRGYGKQLLDIIEQEARKLQVKYIDLTSSHEKKAAHGLYLSSGYESRDTENYRKTLIQNPALLK